MASAKTRAIDVFRRERTARKFAPELTRFVQSEWTLRPAVEDLFLSRNDAERRFLEWRWAACDRPP